MANPIYILHLTDWHLEKTPDNNKNSCAEDYLITLNHFLNLKNRKWFEMLLITGDMMHKNGGDKEHDLATNEIIKIKSKVTGDGYTHTYCVPGNHDLHFENNQNNILEPEIFELIKRNDIPKYLVIDKFKKRFENSFMHYSNFVNDINANNKDNPFSFSSSFKIGDINFNVNGLNTSWLCLAKKQWEQISIDYNSTRTETKEFINFHDDAGIISTGKFINPMPAQIENSFNIGLLHHHPRFLNPFDLYDLDFNSVAGKKKIDKISELYGADFVDIDKLSYSTLNFLKNQHLILTGHTHGMIFDAPYFTSPGHFTPEGTIFSKSVSIIELDVNRNYLVIYHLPIGNDKFDLKNVKKNIHVFNENLFLTKIRNEYTNEDYFLDFPLNIDELNLNLLHESFQNSNLTNLSKKYLVKENIKTVPNLIENVKIELDSLAIFN